MTDFQHLNYIGILVRKKSDLYILLIFLNSIRDMLITKQYFTNRVKHIICYKYMQSQYYAQNKNSETCTNPVNIMITFVLMIKIASNK